MPPEPASHRSSPWWQAGIVVALGGATYLAFRTTREGSILGEHGRLLADIVGFWLLWAVALACLLRARLSRRRLLTLVVVGAAALRIAAMTVVVPLSDDLYRYAWDGSVQAAGVSPYRYAPDQADGVEALAERRTDWLFPDAVEGGDTCAEIGRDDGCTRINRPSVHTVYPPLAQVWFLGGHLAGASQWRDIGWQALSLLPDVATCVLLWLVLVRSGRDPRWAAAFAWSPVAVLEGVQNAHVDGLATFFVVLAVALAGRRPAASGAALAAAALVKLYPALLLPALLVRRPVRVVTAFVAVVAAGYLPHVLVSGADVLGFLPGYLAEEDYDAGDRYLLLRPLGLPGPVVSVLVALLGLAVAVAVWRRARSLAPGAREAGDTSVIGDGPGAGRVAVGACVLLGAALLLATPVQPWYGLPLAALAALARRPEWFALPALAYPVFFAVVPAGPSEAAAWTGTACYAVALAVVLAAAVRRRVTDRPAASSRPPRAAAPP
ncbi:MAG TPA: glycosyltransferase 87 family protein [Mycobacteriales bacterium]|nr:glycosyltransferase 87 family protein [Mycobacteriales bacterium]